MTAFELYWRILAMALSLAPSPQAYRHGALAMNVSQVISDRGPLFKGDDGSKTAALMVAVAYRESSLRQDAVGDRGRSFYWFQIHRSSGGSPELLEDPKACVEKGYAMLKESIRIDPDHPIAFYARGPGYRSLEAQKISSDRMRIAKRLALASR